MAIRFSEEVIMKNAHKMPRPIRISRKLELSSETVAAMAEDPTPQNAIACTKKRTGCPIHTC
jgi:hypothetical protein